MADPVNAIARTSGFRVRTIALKGPWWKMDSGPFLAFLEEGRKPVALLPRAGRRYDLHDPSTNKKTTVTQEVAATLNPFAYVLYRPFPAKKLTIMELLKFAFPVCLREVLIIVLMGIGAGLMGMFAPAATGIVFDRLIPGAERAQLMQMSIFLLVISIATSMFTFARSFAILRLEGKLDTAIQAAVWDRLLGLPVSFFREYSSGDLAQRSLGITTIRQILTGSTMSAIFSGIFSIFSFTLLFYYSWTLALVASGLVLFAFLVITACGVIQVRLQRKLVHISGGISSMLLQFINGLAKFRVSGTERRAFAVWAREFSKKKQIATKARRAQNFLTVFASVFPLLCLCTIFYFHQQFLAMPGLTKITTGDFAAFFGAFAQFLSSMLLLSAAIVGAVGVVPAYERARPIFHTLPEVTEAMASPGKLTGAIEISHITFRYKEDTPAVLHDVSLAIRAGQFVAIVGASGSGKSTLLRLLLGFDKPESGAIYYDGQDLAGVDVQEVRRQMGVVLQTSRPVSGSIFQNIVGSAPLTVENAWEAARLAGIEQDIRQMPMGLHTQISDGGGGISGGQRQRLMIARAIAGRPRILLFDEATSALDNQTQAIVSRSLESLRATRVVIAHRLSTIMHADCIYVLDKGKIVQSGTYQELIEQEGIFSDLARRQMI
jgi:ATP-binding cassette subfamily C protein